MKRSEEALQRALCAELRIRLMPPWMFWHTPNGGARSKAEAGMLKATGVKAGIPDLFVCGPDHIREETRAGVEGVRWTAPKLIALELKAPPKLGPRGASKAKPRVSPAQREVINALAQCGVPTLVVRDVDEVLRQLAQMGVPLRGRTP